ncbi:MAG: GAF domain-containing sensor histidine kinase [Rhodocyclaceae bacterium]|nr:GAF domain-containing sensor histidine kinase [Rhodocyclaceae bacterium]
MASHAEGTSFPTPYDEAARVAALHELALLDTPPEPEFDDLALLAAQICGTPIGLVSFLDADRQWFKAAVGTPVREMPRARAFCAHTIVGGDLFVIPDALADARFAASPLVAGEPHVRFYAGVPLRTPGRHPIGTICVFDVVPRELDARQLGALAALARQAEALIALRAARRAHGDPRVRSLGERDPIAGFLIHDVKNQLMLVSANASYLRDWPGVTAAERAEIVEDIANAAARLQSMLLAALDLKWVDGGTMPLARAGFDLAALVTEVARAGPPTGSPVVVQGGHAPLPLHADRDVVRRVLENLLDNARKYGRGRIVIATRAAAHGGVEVMVRDHGPGVAPADRERVFEPRVRLGTGEGHEDTSRGLGLAFCRAAVEAHGGRIWVEDAASGGSLFCFVLPARGASDGDAVVIPAEARAAHPGSGDRWRATHAHLDPRISPLTDARSSPPRASLDPQPPRAASPRHRVR